MDRVEARRGALPRLIVITDWSLGRERLLEQVGRALAAGPEVAVQHRHPEAPTHQFLEEARALATLCDERGNPLFINGRLDIALLVHAHLHLTAHTPVPAEVRPHLPRDRWLSVAVHDTLEARQASGAEFALLSPVFPPGSKVSDSRVPLGVEGFARLAQELPCPAFALGGITPATAASVRGARGFAAISSILGAADPRLAAEHLLGALVA